MAIRTFFWCALLLLACSSDSFVPVDGGTDAGPVGNDAAEDVVLPEAAPPLSCDGGQTACSDVCVDTQSDGKNCGACGHDCLGGTCAAGVCQPFTLATTQLNISQLVPTDTHLYWSRSSTGTQNGGIFVADLDGKNVTNLYDAGPRGCSGLLLEGQVLYFWCEDAIYDCTLPTCDGGAPSTLTTTPQSVNVQGTALDTTNERIYFSVQTPYDAQTGGYVASVPTTGGAASRVVSADQPNPADLFIDGGYVYWLDYGTYLNDVAQYNGGVRRAPLGTNQTMSVVATDFTDYALSGLTVSGTTVYYGGGATVYTAATSGGLQATFAPGTVYQGRIISDATYVYWTNNVNGGGVYRCEKASCTTPTTLAIGESYPRAIAEDAVSIYWANLSGGQIRRLAK